MRKYVNMSEVEACAGSLGHFLVVQNPNETETNDVDRGDVHADSNPTDALDSDDTNSSIFRTSKYAAQEDDKVDSQVVQSSAEENESIFYPSSSNDEGDSDDTNSSIFGTSKYAAQEDDKVDSQVVQSSAEENESIFYPSSSNDEGDCDLSFQSNNVTGKGQIGRKIDKDKDDFKVKVYLVIWFLILQPFLSVYLDPAYRPR